MDITVHGVLIFVAVELILGLVAGLVWKAPVVDATIKTVVVWGLIIVAVLYLVWTVVGWLGIS